MDGLENCVWSARGTGDLRDIEEANCELAESLVLGELMEGEPLRSTLPLRALTFGERKEARLASTGGSILASASL